MATFHDRIFKERSIYPGLRSGARGGRDGGGDAGGRQGWRVDQWHEEAVGESPHLLLWGSSPSCCCHGQQQ